MRKIKIISVRMKPITQPLENAHNVDYELSTDNGDIIEVKQSFLSGPMGLSPMDTVRLKFPNNRKEATLQVNGYIVKEPNDRLRWLTT